MKRLASILSLVVMCLSLAAAAQQGSDNGTTTPRAGLTQNVPSAARGMYDRAMAMSRAGRVELALTLFEESLKVYPDYFDARLALGNELFKAGRLTEAMTQFEKARRINPRDDQVYLSVGLVMMQQKRYNVAASIFADASLLNPSEPLHRLMRGIALIRQASTLTSSSAGSTAALRDDLYRKAEEALTQAFDLSGHRLPEVYLYRALIFEKRGERARSADELEQYLQANSEAANAEAIRQAIRKLRDPAATSQAVPAPL